MVSYVGNFSFREVIGRRSNSQVRLNEREIMMQLNKIFEMKEINILLGI